MNGPPKTNLRGEALAELRSLILGGRLAPGARVSETALAERLGVSRTPLREAMARLVEEGLLVRSPGGRCQVCSFTMEDVVAAIEIRGVIEGTAARLAAERGAAPELLAAGRDILAAIDRALGTRGCEDFDSYVALNAKFHALLARLPGNAFIEREIERVCRLPLASPSAFLEGQEHVAEFRASLRNAQEQHKAILDAIAAREGSRAEALAREHARLARRNLEYAMFTDRSLVDSIPGLALVADQ